MNTTKGNRNKRFQEIRKAPFCRVSFAIYSCVVFQVNMDCSSISLIAVPVEVLVSSTSICCGGNAL